MASEHKDQIRVEWCGPDGWQVEQRFSAHGDVLEFLNDICAKRFQTNPREVMSEDFDYPQVRRRQGLDDCELSQNEK